VQVAKSPEEFRHAGSLGEGFAWVLSGARLSLLEGSRTVFAFHHAPVEAQWVPEQDSRRRRACYIHPVLGLDGECLTDDFPRDHFHHHGIFWTWPHVQIEASEYDLWADRGIRQVFHRYLDLWAGEEVARVAIENGWYVGNQLVMLERIWITVWKAEENGQTLDFELYLQPVEKPVTLWGAPEKSYGGFTMRFLVREGRPVKITTPDGLSSEDLLETRLPWADLTSRFGEGDSESGATIFTRPDHPDFPPTWLTRHYGPLCVGWPGVEPRTLLPGQTTRLPYRVWIHRGAVTVQTVEPRAKALYHELGARWEDQGDPESANLTP
jgi:hypothetical protein